MTRLERMRRAFIVLIAVSLVMDVALVVYLFWGGSNKTSRQAEEQQLRQELAMKTQQVAPLINIDKKLVGTRADIKKFYAESVPSHWSQISAELHKLEQANGISEQGFRFAPPEETGLPQLQRVKIETGVSGEYGKITHFINALERDKVLFVINQVSVTGQATGTVQLQIKFETFLRGAA